MRNLVPPSRALTKPIIMNLPELTSKFWSSLVSLNLNINFLKSGYSRKKGLFDLWCSVFALFGQFFPDLFDFSYEKRILIFWTVFLWLFSVSVSETWPSIVQNLLYVKYCACNLERKLWEWTQVSESSLRHCCTRDNFFCRCLT